MPKSHFACEYYNSVVWSKMEHDIQHYFIYCSLRIDKIYYFKHTCTTNVGDQLFSVVIIILSQYSLSVLQTGTIGYVTTKPLTFVHYSTGIV